MTYIFLQFCLKRKWVVNDFCKVGLSQKLVFILFVCFSFNSFSQCSADAGADTTKCIEAQTILGGVTAGTGNGILTYAWSPFVGLSCDDCPNPICSATVNTTYTLTITDGDGCVSSDEITVVIAANPDASFSFSSLNSCSNFPVQFSPGAPASIQSYQWNFGDPTSGGLNGSSLQNPSHLFESFGSSSSTYAVTLIATNSNGCKDTVTQNITVLQTPGAELIDPLNNFQNCTGSNFNMTIYNATVGAANLYTIIWGDGTANYSSSSFPSGGLTHLYNTADIFDLSFIVNGTNGCSDTANYIVANITNPSIGVANPGGTIGCGPTTICFPLSSYSNNHISTIYVVNFGDGSVPVTYNHPPPVEICHTYSATSCGLPGNAFTLSIKAANFCDSSFSSVNPIKVYNGPTANFTVPTNRCVNTSVLFTNTTILGYNSSCSRFTTFTWNFGDGSPLLTLNQAILTNPSHTYTLPGTYTVTLTTSNPCSTSTHTATICVEGPPTPNFTLVSPINCVPFSTAVNNSSTALNTCSVASTWSVLYNGSTCLPSAGTWNFSGGTTATSAQPEIQIVSPGTYTVRLTQVNSCGTFLFNQSATGQSVPKITLNTLAPICAGTSVTPIATVNNCYESVDSYNWTLTGGVPSSSTLANPGPVLYPTAGSYTVSLQATNGCGTTSVNTPLAVFSPPIANAGNDVQFCSGGNSSIGSASTAGVSYSWSPSIGLSSGTAANPTLTLTNLTSAPIIYSYVVTATTTPGCFTRDTVQVTVNPNPVLTVNSPTICFGEIASLLVDGAGVGATYNWNISPSLSCLNCPNPDAAPASTTAYTVIGTNTYGCSTTISSTVTVNDLPLTDAGIDNTICLGSSATLTASGASTYTWSPSTFLNTTVGNSVISTPLTPTQYIVTGTAANGCTKNDTINVVVQQPAEVNANVDQTLCAGGTVTLNGSIGGSATTSTWIASSGTFSNVTSLSSTYTPSISAGTVTLTLTTNDPSGPCLAVSDQLVITVNPLPAISSNNAAICLGEIANLNATGAGVGGYYNWTASPTLSCTACESAVANPVNTTTYTISGTNSLGCSNTSTALVTVNPLPVVSAGADVDLCDQPIPYSFVGSPSGGVWSGSPNITNAGVFTPNGAESSNLQYVYTNALTGCQNSDTVAVTVSPAAIPTAIPSYSICVNNAAVNLNTVLSSTPAGGSWSGIGVTNPNFTPSIAGVGTHTVTYSFGAGTCLATVTSAITVNPQPTISANNETICVGQSANLTATGTGDPTLYSWSASPSLSCTACQTTVASPITATTYTVAGTTSLGCTNTTTATVTVNPLPIVNAGNDTTLCDQPIAYTFIGSPSGGTWSGSSNITSAGVFTPNGTEVTNLTYTYSNPLTGCQSSDIAIVTVNPPIIPTVLPMYSICVNNAAVNLNTVLSSTPAGGSWSGIGVTNPNFTPSIAGVGTHTVTYSFGAGTCLATVTSEITVNPQPTISANNATICVGQSANLTATGTGDPTLYNWTASPSLSCTACQTTIASPITTTTYTVEGTTSLGCTNTTPATVTVNPLPIVNAGSDITLCDQPIAYTFIGSPSGGTWSGSPNITSAGVFTPNGTEVTNLTYTYSNPPTGCQSSDIAIVTVNSPIIPTVLPTYSICVNNAAVNLNTVLSSTPAGGSWSGMGVTNPNFTPSLAGVGTHTVTYSIGAGTCLATVTSEITVNPQPSISANNATICVGQTAALNAAGAGVGGVYNWTASPSLSCTACQTTIASPTTATTYTVAGTTSFGCINNATATVTVNPLPVVNAGSDITLCDQPIAYTFIGSPSGGTWSGSSNITSAGVFTPNGTEVTNLTYTYSNPLTGCQNSDIAIVTVNPPIIPTVLPTYSICVNNAAVNLNTVLSSTPAGGSWSGIGVTNPNFTPSLAGVGTHTVTYSIGAGTCLTTVTSAITVNPQPTISANNATICVGQSANLTATGTGDPTLYNWTASPSLSCTACQTTVASPITATTYTVAGTTSLGCSNTTTATVTVNPLPIVNAGSDTTLCDQPIPVQFNGTIPGGIWTGSSITAAGLFTPAGTGSYSLTYTVTLPTGCVNSDIKLINVISIVVSNAGPDLENCVGDPSVVLTSSPAGGVWSGNGVNASGLYTPSTAGLFELIYTTGAGNCISRDTMLFNVYPLPVVSAGIDRDFCITDNTFNFSGLPLGGSWSGVGITDAVNGTFDPSIAGAGLFQIVYSFTDLVTNCINRDTLIATVHALPVVDFTYNPIVCQGVNEAFTNTSTAVALSNWNFGDGTLSSNFSPTHTYNSPGLFDVQLIITSPFGCIDSLTQVIEVRDIPFAEFTVAIDSACGPLTTEITNSSTGSGLSYNWQFGNGQTTTAQNPTPQVYQAAIGIDTMYYIVLTATNNCGVVSYTDSIIVMPLPIASFDTDVNSGCSPLLLNIANLSSGIPDNYSWDFGNGSTSISAANTLQQTFLTGATISNYTISLNVQNECGSDTFSQVITVYPNTVTAFFNSSTTIGCEDLTVDFTQSTLGGIFYSWDFGDNNTSTSYSPSHTFVDPGTYTVSLFVNDGCAYDTMNVNITVNPAPLLSFSVFPDSVCINEAFTFTNTSSNLANSFWTFGDGGTSGLTNPSYAYSQSGQYNVTLVGTSITNGCVDSISQTVQVIQSTVSSFATSSNSGCAPFTVQFSNQSTNSAYHYWVFGDGNTSTQQNPSHLYALPGTYQVQLITENASGCSDTSTSTITVHAIPVSDFSFISSNTCYVPVEVELTNLSTGALNYSWDFGNGQTSTNTNATVTYTAPGVYNISLIAENQYGCQAQSQQSITVYPTPIAQFDLPSSVACANDVLSFGSESLFADSINWIMGDGTILSGANVDYAYTVPGDYYITLIAYGAGGCGDTLVLGSPLTINPDPVADFDYINVQIPDPLSGLVEYTNLSEGATSFLWYFGNDSSSTEINPVFNFNDYGTYNTTLIATNNFGCTDSITLIVNVDFFNGLFLPNAIYPGSDLFEVSHFIPKGVGLKEFELLIFDDWGNLIWQSTALDASGRPSEFWDGTFNGEPVQQDAYVWKVNAVFLDNEVWGGNDLNYKKIKKSGTVTVIR